MSEEIKELLEHYGEFPDVYNKDVVEFIKMIKYQKSKIEQLEKENKDLKDLNNLRLF